MMKIYGYPGLIITVIPHKSHICLFVGSRRHQFETDRNTQLRYNITV